MARTISAQLEAHFLQETTTLATLWTITRTDGIILGFTNLDIDLTYNALLYKASSVFTPSDIALKSDLSVSNLEVDSIIDSLTITEPDLYSGLYDFASVLVEIVNYIDLSMGSVIIFKGTLGEININRGAFTAELRGLSQQLQNNTNRYFTPTCRALLGDAKCTKDLTAFTFAGVVSQVISTIQIYSGSLAQGLNYFANGVITFTSGLNINKKVEVVAFQDGTITFASAFPYSISVNETFSIVAGCDKTIQTCKDKFNNIINFRGEPHVPGQDAILKTAGTFK